MHSVLLYLLGKAIVIHNAEQVLITFSISRNLQLRKKTIQHESQTKVFQSFKGTFIST